MRRVEPRSRNEDWDPPDEEEGEERTFSLVFDEDDEGAHSNRTVSLIYDVPDLDEEES